MADEKPKLPEKSTGVHGSEILEKPSVEEGMSNPVGHDDAPVLNPDEETEKQVEPKTDPQNIESVKTDDQIKASTVVEDPKKVSAVGHDPEENQGIFYDETDVRCFYIWLEQRTRRFLEEEIQTETPNVISKIDPSVVGDSEDVTPSKKIEKVLLESERILFAVEEAVWLFEDLDELESVQKVEEERHVEFASVCDSLLKIIETQLEEAPETVKSADNYPIRSENYPSRTERMPSRSEYYPSRTERMPSRSEYYPSRSERMSSRSEYYPSRSERMSSRSEYYPSRSERKSSRSERKSSRSERKSSRSEHKPRRAEHKPKCSERSPQNIETEETEWNTSGESDPPKLSLAETFRSLIQPFPSRKNFIFGDSAIPTEYEPRTAEIDPGWSGIYSSSRLSEESHAYRTMDITRRNSSRDEDDRSPNRTRTHSNSLFVLRPNPFERIRTFRYLIGHIISKPGFTATPLEILNNIDDDKVCVKFCKLLSKSDPKLESMSKLEISVRDTLKHFEFMMQGTRTFMHFVTQSHYEFGATDRNLEWNRWFKEVLPTCGKCMANLIKILEAIRKDLSEHVDTNRSLRKEVHMYLSDDTTIMRNH